MNIIDVVIILGLLLGGFTGARSGFLNQSVVLLGTIATFILAWIFKTPLANLLSYNLPFFNFAGPFEGVTALNIVMYQLIAFLFLWLLLVSVLIVFLRMTKIIEKILKATIVFGIPSKILGFFVGILEAYVILFVLIFFLNQPVLNIGVIRQSVLAPPILNSSPILSHTVKNTNEAIKDIYEISKDTGNTDKDTLNKEITDNLLKHKVINEEYLNNLREKNKINY